ncbi:MAG: C45 family autoproteolytic acyltransferase/hydrolase [Acidobacteriota bacterium]
MKAHPSGALVVLVSALSTLAQGAAAAAPSWIANASFEKRDVSGRPAHWKMEAAGGAQTSVVRVDSKLAHSGAASLAIASPASASVTVTSAPLSLQVGHLYRLSGWISTAGARADPTSRYPTAVAACLTMASFPFTNHSPVVGAASPWRRVETLFIATQAEDRLRLHLGHNGTATGAAWFDDVAVEEVDDIDAYVPAEGVRWFGPAYRYDDRGWIFLHLEGAPYARGYQCGNLMATEISDYATKLGTLENNQDPPAGWRSLRASTDSLMLRKFSPELLEEMKGIADGAAHAGAKLEGHAVDLLDIATLNSVVDLGQLKGALGVTPTALSGRSFLKAEDELLLPEKEHRCSSFAATGPATADGRVVFGQLFMWNGYTGVHWNVICDLVPSAGHRLVYETFPGGIHSGADFYINDAGIIIGETTTAQTPFEASGTPQSDRIRRAAQYASSIDDVARILREGNNGLYTNDWPIADIKTDEVAILLLGTHADRLWRTSEDLAPFGTPGFLWSNNNGRDLDVRKEYAVQPGDAPSDLAFAPWNRDLAFSQFYQRFKGALDATAAIEMLASSPINRSHACDGKVTTSQMAEQLAFLAHYGKVTLREKFPEKGNRRMPDLPGAIPHLTLGYSTPSPIFVTERLKAARRDATGEEEVKSAPFELDEAEAVASFAKRKLWRGTVYPATLAENWFSSGSAALWRLLDGLPEEPEKAFIFQRDQLAELNNRLLWVLAREEDVAPRAARQLYDRYGHYQIPRIKGTFAVHHVRLLLGNEQFATVMSELHAHFQRRPATTAELIAEAERLAGRPLAPFIGQWIDRTGLPDPRPEITLAQTESGWTISLTVSQPGQPYHLLTTLAIEAGGKQLVKRAELEGPVTSLQFDLPERPARVVFNAGNDFPAAHPRYFGWPNWADDFSHTLIVYGTARQIEANHTLALRFQTTLADAFSEILPPVVQDAELTEEQAAAHDLIVLGQPEDNSLTARLAASLPATFKKNLFTWQGKTHAASDEGLLLVLPNPSNSKHALYLYAANSALELYQMTKTYLRDLPSWALFKGDKVTDKGYHPIERFTLTP